VRTGEAWVIDSGMAWDQADAPLIAGMLSHIRQAARVALAEMREG
jgi:hypothetical protein